MRQHSVSLREYHELNTICRHGGSVLFGSTFGSQMHVSELAQDFDIRRPVYNRSMEKASVYDAADMLPTCVYELEPDEVFVNLGEEDLDFTAHTMEEVLAQYEWLLYQIHSTVKKCAIYVVSVCSDHPNAEMFNQALRTLARNAGCRYVDITSAASDDRKELHAFGILRSFLRVRGLCLGDAMSVAPDFI